MIVNSENVEFGYEMISVIPYAYYLHTISKLTETISGIGSEPIYSSHLSTQSILSLEVGIILINSQRLISGFTVHLTQVNFIRLHTDLSMPIINTILIWWFTIVTIMNGLVFHR